MEVLDHLALSWEVQAPFDNLLVINACIGLELSTSSNQLAGFAVWLLFFLAFSGSRCELNVGAAWP